ncbi:MAG: hypothetical protein L0H73_09605 [Nitrococcus sp.]|nr:hypothetical protein [Nitrococcus sp.]
MAEEANRAGGNFATAAQEIQCRLHAGGAFTVRGLRPVPRGPAHTPGAVAEDSDAAPGSKQVGPEQKGLMTHHRNACVTR